LKLITISNGNARVQVSFLRTFHLPFSVPWKARSVANLQTRCQLPSGLFLSRGDQGFFQE